MSKKKILFGTSNIAKLERIRAIVKDLPLEIMGSNDLNINIEVTENGCDVHENALLKARTYYDLSKIPTFAIDSGLYIEKFPEEKQPGLFVRRINGKSATDEEMLEYYTAELKKVGGESRGYWISSITFIFNKEKAISYELIEERFFTAKRSPVMKKGWPLSSLAIEPTFNKYVSEITKEERAKLQEKTDREIYNIFAEIIDVV
ncbi:MAG: hypothetical protein PWR10_483 [Halanaerobiales bacterium]|nr:hypothetical protein [Halanaerobiales bacterium]